MSFLALFAMTALLGACGGEAQLPEVRYYAISDQ
jgi:hypothetical protein